MLNVFSLYAATEAAPKRLRVQLNSSELGAACRIAFLIAAGALATTAQPPKGDEILTRMAAHQLADNKVLTHYTGLRVYTLHNSRFQINASMTVRVEYRVDTGKTFSIVTQTGSARVRQRVFDPLLKTEADESRPDRRGAFALNTANYRAELVGRETRNGSDCWVLSVEPLRRSRLLLRGKLWVDAAQLQPVEFQGHPAGSVSFWVAEPLITETLSASNGFWLPANNTSVSNGFILGASELTINYVKYDIDVPAPRFAP